MYDQEYPVGVLIRTVQFCQNRTEDEGEELWQKNSLLPFDESMSLRNFAKAWSRYSGLDEATALLYASLPWLSVQHRHGCGYRVACFSETNSSIPMWAYYANEHKGVCLEYDPRLLDDCDPEQGMLRRSFIKIHYSEQRPRDTYGEYSLIVKSSQWAHEREWRLICAALDNRITVPCLSAVYIGANFNNDQLLELLTAIDSYKRKLKVFICRPNRERYELDFVDVSDMGKS